jgi:uncharacterized delta-60 repeat protein
MQINFRQGIISSQSLPRFLQKNLNGNIDFNASDSQTILNFADGASNYLWYEPISITDAWITPTEQACWLYWDISTENATRSFGYTLYNPFSVVAPSNPQLNQMYFNTSTFKYQSWTGQYWRDVIRVIAGAVDASGNIITQSSGTQINLYQTVTTDVIVYDFTQMPIKNYTPNGYEFLNKFTITNFKNNSKDSFKYERIVNANGMASEDIIKHYCVTWKDYNTLQLADPEKINNPAFALAEKMVNTGEIISLCTEGFVVNRTDWNWPNPPHTSLYVGTNGILTPEFDPTFSKSLQLVGYIVSPNTIYVNFNNQYSKYITSNNTILPTISVTPTPESTSTMTPTPTITPTLTMTPTATVTITPTITITPTLTMTPTATVTITPTITITPTPAIVGTVELFAGGYFQSFHSQAYGGLAKIHSDGTIDTALTPFIFDNSDGDGVDTLYRTADGKIYMCGYYISLNGSTTYRYLTRLNSDGTLDNTFTNLNLDNEAYTALQTIDDKIYIGGWLTSIGGQSVTGLARLNSDGTLDNTYTPPVIDHTMIGGIVSIQHMHQTIDGKIYIGGSFTTIDGNAYGHLARLNSDGTLDTTFTNIGLPLGSNTNHLFAICQTIDGKIYISCSGLCRLNSDGTIDNTFVAPNSTSPLTIYQTIDGKIYMGNMTVFNGTSYQYLGLYRMNSDGTLDNNFVPINNGSYIEVIYQTSDDKIYMCATRNASGTSPLSPIRLNSDGTLDNTFITGNNTPSILTLLEVI